MGKFAWFLLIVLIVVVLVYSFPELLDPSFYGVPGDSNGGPFVVLDVRLEEFGEWSGNLGHPTYTSNVTYFVYNLGDANATNVHVALKVNEILTKDFFLPSLTSEDYFEGRFTVVVTSSQSKNVTLTASCENSTDTTAFNLRAALDRSSFNSQISKLYVTPDDPLVLTALANITSSDLIPDWIEIRDWVANNIDYAYDSEVHGVPEYWQFPNETLMLGTGDCEDFSILLCSLLRADGWDEQEAYVVIGAKDRQYHGWLQLDVDVIGWQSIEPQADAWNTWVGDFLTLSGFKAKYMFNDVYFVTQ